jgi:hypothetical protein
MMITKKKIHRVLEGVIAAMPAIPLIMKRRRTSVSTWVFGGIAFALAGGLATLMLLSPRTRSRALHAAKDTYDKVNDKVLHLQKKEGSESPMSNGLVDRGDYATTTTGL